MMMLSASRSSSVASVWRRNFYPILCGRGLSSAVGNTSSTSARADVANKIDVTRDEDGLGTGC